MRKIYLIPLLLGLASNPASAASIKADYGLSYGTLGNKNSLHQEVSLDLEDRLSPKNYWFIKGSFNIRSDKDDRWTYLSDKMKNNLSLGFGNRLIGDYLRVGAGISASFWDKRFRGGFSAGAEGIWSKGDYYFNLLSLGRDYLFDTGSNVDLYKNITAGASIQKVKGGLLFSAGPGYSITGDKINTDITLLFNYRNDDTREVSGGIRMSLSFTDENNPYLDGGAIYRDINETYLPLQPSAEEELVPIDDHITCIGRCALKKHIGDKLKRAEETAEKRGYSLAVRSSLRSKDEQKHLHEKYMNRECDPDYESCSHVKGTAVDVIIPQLKDKLGCFGTGCKDNIFYNPENKQHKILRDIMVSAGFRPSAFEWWHFEG